MSDSEPESARVSSAYFDEFSVDVGARSQETPFPTPEVVQACILIFQRHATGVSNNEVEERADSATAMLQQEFANLTSLQTEMVSRLDERRHDLEQEYMEKRRQLETEIENRRQDLDAKHHSEMEAVGEERARLEARTKELNDRDHMHVRRELREKITTDIQSRLGEAIVPVRTSLLRYGVLGLSVVGAIVLGDKRLLQPD